MYESDATGEEWDAVSKHRYVYGGWSLLMELPVTGSDESLTVGDPARMYTWGLDISGQSGNATAGSGDSSVSGLHGAGGIGGLLAVLDTNNTTTTSDDRNFTYCYDANGNVGQLVEWASGAGGASGTAWATARMAARYEYDPYGNTISKSGSCADTNPFRFSTKFLDPETGLYYYGYRYYSPRLGRWINRDPIEEEGGVALLAFVANSPTLHVDYLGLEYGKADSECERAWCIANALCCAHAKENSEQARDELTRRYGGGVNRDHTVFNAIKHCVWMCKIATLCGCSAAAGLGDCHECGQEHDDPAKQMDLHNNIVGRQCAGCVGPYGITPSPGGAASWSQCFQCCERAALSGRLKWFQPGCPRYFGADINGDVNGRGVRLCRALHSAGMLVPRP